MTDNQQVGPSADLKKLNRLIGSWNVSDPSGQHAINGQVSYRWMEGEFFLIQEVDLHQSGQHIKGLEIIGHEQPFGGQPSEAIKSRFYDSQGNTWDYVYEIDEDTLTIWAGEKDSPAYYRGKFNVEGTENSGAWVYPGGGGYASKMTKIE